MKNNNINGKRITAYLIDVLIVYVIISLIISIRVLNPTYDKYVEQTAKYNETLEKYYDGDIIIILALVGYYVFFQKYNNGQTIGKKLMKIKVVLKDTQENAKLSSYLIRLLGSYYLTIGSIIPLFINSILVFVVSKTVYMNLSTSITYIFVGIGIISLILVLCKKESFHDKLAKTMVVSEK